LAVAVAACLTGAWAQAGPHLGYVYPAGGKQGAVLRVTVGGQSLRNPEYVYVSGVGVSASVVEYIRPLDDQELGETWWFMRDMVRRRWSARAMAAARAQPPEKPPLPDHPWLRDLDEKSPEQLARLRAVLFDPKKQPNAQIAEQVEILVSIDPNAPPGDRELRLLTATGLSNPLRFQVGTLPEAREEDLVDPGDPRGLPVDLPVVLNGQIRPGEADRFRLRARKGQRLVVRVQARQLIPYLADAVPGWFQATVTLYDPQGQEVAYDDDYRFDPDPVLFYQVPQDGDYTLEIHDALYRGREDFVYRVSVGELPFVTSIFPLGGPAGAPTPAALTGWNLPTPQVQLDTAPGGEALRTATWTWNRGISNAVAYAVDTLPEATETEPNDSETTAQRVSLPLILNGRIDKPGDVDVYQFAGQAGEEVVAEVWARRLNSPLDSALRLVDAKGTEIAANDDHDDPGMGLLTHQADSYLRVKLAADGAYRIYLCDAQRQGGDEYAYRLRLSQPRPDFALRVTPSSLSMPARRPAAATVHALRRDGFDGDIDIVLKDAPAGFTLSPARIPGDKDSVQVTVTAPRDAPAQLWPIRLEGRAQIDGVSVTRPVVPAEDMMQAFAYRQLVPEQELLVAVTGSRPVPVVWRPLVLGVSLTGAQAVGIPLGGTAQVQVTAPPTLPDSRHSALPAVRFTLCDPPRGVRLQGARVVPTGVILTFKADANSARLGQTANLIVEASVEPPAQPLAGQPALRQQRLSLGVLPAIPCRIVRGTP
jgi:hypothetical protein